jgi:transposase
MAKFEKRLEAIKLRKRGFSIIEIAKKLEVSKSTSSVWCRDIELNKKQKDSLYNKMVEAGHKGRLIGANKNKESRLKEIEYYDLLAVETISNLNKKERLILLSALYWAEGLKNNGSFTFTNSDPVMIKLVSKILIDDFNLTKEDLMPRLSINIIHKHRIDDVLKFWSNLLELPIDYFGKPYFSSAKQKKVYDNHDRYFGVLILKIKNGTKYRYKVLSLIKAIINSL